MQDAADASAHALGMGGVSPAPGDPGAPDAAATGSEDPAGLAAFDGCDEDSELGGVDTEGGGVEPPQAQSQERAKSEGHTS